MSKKLISQSAALAAAAALVGLGQRSASGVSTTWNAPPSSGWSSASNWTNGEPTQTVDAILPNSSSGLIFMTGVEVCRTLTINGNYQLANGMLVNNNGDVITGAGTATTLTTTLITSGSVGTHGLIKGGTGTLILGGSAVNSFTGGVTINAGTLSIFNDTKLGNAANGVLINGGTLETTSTFATSRSITIGASGGTIAPAAGTYTINSGFVADANALTTTGAGRLELMASSARTGTTAIEGTTALLADNPLGTGAITVNSGGLLELDHADAITAISTPITINSGGTVLATVASNYPGDWPINGGTLRVQNAAALGTGVSTITLDSGDLLQIEGVTVSRNLALNGAGALKGTGTAAASGTITAAASASNLTLATGATATDAFTVNIYTGGSGSTTHVTGSGEIILPNNSTYAGDWAIDSGSLRIDNPGATGSGTSPIVVNSGGTFHLNTSVFRNVTLNNGSTLKGGAAVGQAQSAVSIAAGAAVTLSSAASGHLSMGVGAGTLSGGGSGSSITIAPSSFVSLHKTSSYTGNWIINGTLQVTDDAQLGNAANTVTLGGFFQADASITTSRHFIAPGSIRSSGTTTLNTGLSGSGGSFFAIGPGTTVLNAAGTYSGTFFSVQSLGTLKINHSSALGSGLFLIDPGSALELGAGVTLSQPMNPRGTLRGNNGASCTGTITADMPSGDPFTLATANSGDIFTIGDSSNDLTGGTTGSIITAAGPGKIVLGAQSDYAGNWLVSGGTLEIAAEDRLGAGGSVTVNSGGTFQLNGAAMTIFPLIMNAGTLRAVGLCSYSNSGSPQIANSIANVNFTVAGASDRLDIGTAIRSVSASASSSTIHVNGGGRLRLQSGGTSATDIFGGSWEQSSGILQVGQSAGNSINGLGFKSGDARQANTITVNGGTLAVGVLGSGTATPAWLRANVILSGGAIASTNGVNAQYGGGFTVSAGITSKVLLFDPVSTSTARSVSLVAGAAGTDNLAGATSWGAGSTLIVDPGTTSGGVFSISRTGGTITVGTGATLQINPGATVNLGGAADALSDGTHHVDVVNNSGTTMNVISSLKNVGAISGIGNTNVNLLGSLNATRIRQNALTIGPGSKVTIRPSGGDSGVSYLNTLNLSGTLDLNDNDLVVTYGTNPSSFTTIRDFVFNGYSASPDPSKTGIISTTGQSAGNTILAVIDNALVGASDWPTGSGHTIDANSVIGKYTYFGDMDLSGDVTADDYGILDANFGTTPPPGIAWISGDADLSGDVTPDDYGILDANFGSGVGNPLAPSVAGAGTIAIPEPSGLALAGAAGLLLRRRRKS